MARGATDKKDWTVPGPLRALMWWPGAAFVLVLVDPVNAAVSIAASGAVLVLLGFLAPLLARRLRPAVVGAVAAPDREAPTMEIDMPTIEMPRANHAA